MRRSNDRNWRILGAVLACGLLVGGTIVAADAPVTGTFKGNGKAAKLAFVSAHTREDFSDKPALQLIFTEKDHSKDKKPDWNASFGRFGCALVISTFEDGRVFGCEVSHTAHGKGTFSSVGSIEIKDIKIADGKISGRLTTNGEQEFFKDTWDVDLTFSTALPPGAFKSTTPSEPEKPAKTDKPVTRPTTKPATETPSKTKEEPATEKPAATISVHDLPIPADATDVERKKLVEHLAWKSPGDVKSSTDQLIKQLAAKGWKKEGSDLITPKSVILHRKNGAADLTIFVKPEGTGSKVSMMTKGLSWEDK